MEQNPPTCHTATRRRIPAIWRDTFWECGSARTHKHLLMLCRESATGTQSLLARRKLLWNDDQVDHFHAADHRQNRSDSNFFSNQCAMQIVNA